jgi:hypothetical protein
MLEPRTSSEPTYENVRSLLNSAIAQAGSVGRDSVKRIRERVSQSFSSNGMVNDAHSKLVVETVLSSKDGVAHMQDNFEEFQAQQNAKLESWLTEE